MTEFFWDVILQYWVICSWHFQVAYWSHLQRLKCVILTLEGENAALSQNVMNLSPNHASPKEWKPQPHGCESPKTIPK